MNGSGNSALGGGSQNNAGGWGSVNFSDPNYWANWNQTAAGLGGTIGTWISAFGGQTGTTYEQQQQQYQMQQQQYLEEQRRKQQTNMIIWAVVGLAVLALILFFVLRKK